jgi:hypothetical protein
VIAFAALVILALFWVGFIALVKREQGWVGITDLQRAILSFTGWMVLVADEIANALIPAIRAAAKAMNAWRVEFEAANVIEKPEREAR